MNELPDGFGDGTWFTGSAVPDRALYIYQSGSGYGYSYQDEGKGWGCGFHSTDGVEFGDPYGDGFGFGYSVGPTFETRQRQGYGNGRNSYPLYLVIR
jgi:hypothetical protein